MPYSFPGNARRPPVAGGSRRGRVVRVKIPKSKGTGRLKEKYFQMEGKTSPSRFLGNVQRSRFFLERPRTVFLERWTDELRA
jgi:hypothetical protein